MSNESAAIFLTEWVAYEKVVASNPAADTSALVAAAIGHSGASRPQLVVQNDYLTAQAEGDIPGARTLADELTTIRMADEIVAGNLPFRAPTINNGG